MCVTFPNPRNPPSPFGEIQASPYTSERFEPPPRGARHQRPRNRPEAEAKAEGPGMPVASKGLPSGSNKHSWLENPHVLIGHTSSFMVDFLASYVRLPECIGLGLNSLMKHSASKAFKSEHQTNGKMNDGIHFKTSRRDALMQQRSEVPVWHLHTHTA